MIWPSKRSLLRHAAGWAALLSTLLLYLLGSTAAAFWLAFSLCAAALFFYCIADDQYRDLNAITKEAITLLEEVAKEELVATHAKLTDYLERDERIDP